MKFAIAIFLPVFYLVAVSAGGESHASNDNFIPKSFMSLNTVDCAITDVLQLKGLIETYITDMQCCSSDVNDKLQPMIDICHQIIETLNDILNIKGNVCNDTATDDLMDVSASADQGKSSFGCLVKLLHKTLQLLRQVGVAIKLIEDIPLMYGDADECVNSAVNNLAGIFNQFTSKVKTCSKQN